MTSQTLSETPGAQAQEDMQAVAWETSTLIDDDGTEMVITFPISH